MERKPNNRKRRASDADGVPVRPHKAARRDENAEKVKVPEAHRTPGRASPSKAASLELEERHTVTDLKPGEIVWMKSDRLLSLLALLEKKIEESVKKDIPDGDRDVRFPHIVLPYKTGDTKVTMVAKLCTQYPSVNLNSVIDRYVSEKHGMHFIPDYNQKKGASIPAPSVRLNLDKSSKTPFASGYIFTLMVHSVSTEDAPKEPFRVEKGVKYDQGSMKGLSDAIAKLSSTKEQKAIRAAMKVASKLLDKHKERKRKKAADGEGGSAPKVRKAAD